MTEVILRPADLNGHTPDDDDTPEQVSPEHALCAAILCDTFSDLLGELDEARADCMRAVSVAHRRMEDAIGRVGDYLDTRLARGRSSTELGAVMADSAAFRTYFGRMADAQLWLPSPTGKTDWSPILSRDVIALRRLGVVS